MTTFDGTKGSLPARVHDVLEGEIHVPDVPWSWVWDEEHVQNLLVSVAPSAPVVAQGYPAHPGGHRREGALGRHTAGLIVPAQQRISTGFFSPNQKVDYRIAWEPLAHGGGRT